MNTLYIDTCNNIANVSISTGGKLMKSSQNSLAAKQAEQLFTLIAECLKAQNLDYKDIENIAVNIGPGSFTGIRIGLAAAVGLRLALHIPIVSLNYFEIFYQNVINQHTVGNIKKLNPDINQGQNLLQKNNSLNNSTLKDDIAIILDARRGQVFCKIFYAEDFSRQAFRNNNTIENIRLENSPYLLLTYQQAAELITTTLISPIISGPALELVLPYIDKNYKYTAISSEYNMANELAPQIASSKIVQQQYDIAPVPLYIRSADAKLPQV